MPSKKPTKTRQLKFIHILRNVVIAILVWFAFWILTQYLFLGKLPAWLMNISDALSPQQQFIAISLWINLIALIGIFLWHKTFRDYSFLKAPKKTYLAYILPAVLAAILLLQPTHFGVNSLIYAIGMVTTTFWQDLLTFGFLYTYLQTQVKPEIAAFLTALVFYAGHFMYDLPLTMLLVYIVGFLFFAYLRYKTRSIHLTYVTHLSFILLPM